MPDSSDGAEAAPNRPAKRGTGIDFDGMTAAELTALQEAVAAAIRRKQEEARAALVAKWRAEAAENNIPFKSLLPALGRAAPAAAAGRGRKAKPDDAPKAAPKFRDPATGETWTGRGRAPGWIKGKNRDDFRI